MDIQKILNRAKAIKAANAQLTTQVLVQELAKRSTAEQEACFAKDRVAGFVFLYSSATAGGYVLELIQSFDTKDSVIALYVAHPILSSRQKVIDLRRDLIGAIEHLINVAPGQSKAYDKQRQRDVLLGELSTIQLIGMVKEILDGKAVKAAIDDATKVAPLVS
jgi:hypothetical protein